MDTEELLGIRGSVEIENRLRQKLTDKLQAGTRKEEKTNKGHLHPKAERHALDKSNGSSTPGSSITVRSAVVKAETIKLSPIKSDVLPSTSKSRTQPISVVHVVKNSTKRHSEQPSSYRPHRNFGEEDFYSKANETSSRRSYSGYDYSYNHNHRQSLTDGHGFCQSRRKGGDAEEKSSEKRWRRSRSPMSPQLSDRRSNSYLPIEQPKPVEPREIPEHIKWLHDRWSKYDNPDFFSKGASLKPADFKKESSSSAAVKETSTLNRNSKDENLGRKNKLNASGSRRKSDQPEPSSYTNRKLSSLKSDYMSWRYGGLDRDQIPYLLSFKEFLLSLPEDVGETDSEQIKAINRYTEYKMNFKRRAYRNFFDDHKDEEWFLQKYHPVHKTKFEAKRKEIVQRRLDIFMFLLVRGWIEAHVEYTDSRKIRKLLDAACILLQEGKESDIMLLSDFDYVLEEKRELSYDLAREQEEKERLENEKKRKKDRCDSTSQNSNGDCDMEDLLEREQQVEETKKKEETELEIAQHARDYTKFVAQHTEDVALPSTEQESNPPTLPKIQISKTCTETRYIGDGVFVQRPQLILDDKTPLSETILHRALSLCFRDISSKVFRDELEQICTDAHGGFMRLYLSDPDPQRSYCRQAIASFWADANLMKICWTLRARKLHTGQPLNVVEYRDFSKRIDLIDGLASDKSIVLRDIQLCKSLIEFLDRRYHLWSAERVVSGQTSSGNPLLNKLDECLTFHLQQLIESGQVKDLADIDATIAEAAEPVKPKNVDRDENLIKILDRLILYLRLVHSVDYYGCKFYENEDYEPRRIGLVHLRGPCYKQATPKQLAEHIRTFEENLQQLLPNESRLGEEHVELLGKMNIDDEIQKFVNNNIISVKDGFSKCCSCYKRFTSLEFARDHYTQKHPDIIEQHKLEITTFNTYLYDPNRLCHVSF